MDAWNANKFNSIQHFNNVQHIQMTLNTVPEEVSALSGLTWHCIYCSLSSDAEVSKIRIKIKKQLWILTDILSYTSYRRCSGDIHVTILLVFSILILISVRFSSLTLKYLIHMNFLNLLNTNPFKLYIQGQFILQSTESISIQKTTQSILFRIHCEDHIKY